MNGRIILWGADLEEIKSELCGEEFLGTDPDKSQVVRMKEPSLMSLEDQELAQAIREGVYTSLLSTNARMFMDGVVRLLQNDIVAKGTTDSIEMKAQRIAVAGYRLIMTYPLRVLADLNGLQGKTLSEKEDIFRLSFLYPWMSAITECPHSLQHLVQHDNFLYL